VASCPTCGNELGGDFAFCPHCGTALTTTQARSREQRKVVTVLFCDVTDSTELGEQLDPEALRALLARYFEQMKMIVERHGGSVEKFIGDAVMAVFGVPVAHEDDAFRAVRAAADMRDAFPALGCQGRIGVMTGEVVTGTTERLATGDAVNVAARLEQAAAPGEILVGEATFRLARDAIEVEQLAALSLKGKAEPVAAYRLMSVRGDQPFTRQLDTPMVGRATELGRLGDAFEQAVRDRSCQLFTILGPAGVGKSRLVLEFVASRDNARIVRGRCLPYGDGITYWPVIEVAKQLPPAAFEGSGAETIAALLRDEQVATSREEIAWSFRHLLETVAADQPLVCVFDDIQWGEPTFLDLVEHIADLSRDAPILLLCMARPELLDRRPGWAGGKVNATTVLLEPLRPEETDALIESLGRIDGALANRIREAAEGNPLFVEQMVALVKESGNGDVAVPPTIQALLAARLDQLDAPERFVLERGSVEGRVFHRRAVEALAPDEAAVATRLTSLVRKEIVRPDRPVFPGDDAFRFRHLLIRDAAYDSLPKTTRAELHERFAEWLGSHGQDLVELDELVGYHLEQAWAYRRQLGLPDDDGATLGERAAEHLARGGRRAVVRGDLSAAVRLLERATSLLPPESPQRLKLLPGLGTALIDTGAWDDARTVFSEAATTAQNLGDRGAAADATLGLVFVEIHTDVEASHAKARANLERARQAFEELDDKAGLARALTELAMLRFWSGDNAGAVEEMERAAQHARDAGDRAQELQALAAIVMSLLYGPVPVPDALEKISAIERDTEGAMRLHVQILRARAGLEALRGDFDKARKLIAEATRTAEELGLESLRAASVLRMAGEIEMLASDPVAAARALGEACDTLERDKDWGHLTSVGPLLAQALVAQGRVDEAERPLELTARWIIEDDSDAQIAFHRARARLAALKGNATAAESLARQAVQHATASDDINSHAGALVDHADALELNGRRDEAGAALRDALVLYERKGNLVEVERVRRRLAQ
jgi:class 3 adenylate cyclase/tetratricopeptide (TPR) repeat protein